MEEDFFGDFESTPTSTVRKKNQRQHVENPFLHADEMATVSVLVVDYLSERQIQYVKRLFDSLGVRFNLVFPFTFIPEDSDLKKSMTKFFIENVRSDLIDFLPCDKPIITFGRALYAVTFDTDIQVDGFYDTVFNKSYIYSPSLNNRVYPCDSIFRIFGFGQVDKKTGEAILLWDQWETYFAKEQIKRASKAGDCSLARIPEINVVDLKDPNEFFKEVLSHGDDPAWHYLTLDTETGGLDPLSDKLGCVTMSFDGRTAYYMEWKDIDIPLFEKMLEGKFKILANGKFDILFFAFHGTKLFHIEWDTMIAGHMLNEMRSQSLKSHAWFHTPFGGYDLELEKLKMKYKNLQSYLHIPKPVRMPYAGKDAAVTFLVYKAQMEEMQRDLALLKYFTTYAIGMLNVFVKAEFHGFPIDWNKVTEIGVQLDTKIKEAYDKVLAAFGVESLNISSKKQLGEFIESLGWPCIARVKEKIGGYYKVSKDEIHEWVKLGYNQAKTLLEYSKWVAIKSTFIGNDEYDPNEEEGFLLEEEAREEDGEFFGDESHLSSTNASGLWKHKRVDGRVHATFLTFMAASHRNRSASPNLQNIPKKSWDAASMVRACYTPPLEVRCKKEDANLIKIFDQNLGCRLFSPGDKVLVVRDGTKTTIKAFELKETDTLTE